MPTRTGPFSAFRAIMTSVRGTSACQFSTCGRSMTKASSVSAAGRRQSAQSRNVLRFSTRASEYFLSEQAGGQPHHEFGGAVAVVEDRVHFHEVGAADPAA